MKTRIWTLVLMTALVAFPSAAQESSSMLASVLQTLRLPKTTQEARTLGVPESDIRAILDRAREKRVSAAAVNELLETENKAIREHGPVDNFGAFVQRRLDEGLRGRDLADAIRAEHAAHGKGKGPDTPGAAKGKGHAEETPGAAKGKKGGSR